MLTSCGPGKLFGPTITLTPTTTNTPVPTSTKTPTLIPTNTITLTPTNTVIPTNTMTATATLSMFAASEMSNSAVDITDIEVNVKGEMVEVIFYLEDVPAELTFQRDGIEMNRQEYSWEICVDTDNDKNTGDSMGDMKGSDYCLEATSFKFEDSPNTVPIEQGVQVSVWELTGQGGSLVSPGRIDVDTEKDTIKLSGKISGIADDSLFYYKTFDMNPDGEHEIESGQLLDQIYIEP